jgi:nicotinate-nucleotide adenylyltransferase
MRRLGILGGTFNPPHNGHIHAARQTQLALGLDGIVLMPDNIPPHKIMPEGSADTRQRLAMTQLAAKEIPGAAVSDLELRRGGRSYTVDTLTELVRQNPDTEYHFIMGTDMLLTLDKWYRPEEICRLCALAVVARDEKDRAAIAEAAGRYEKIWNARIDRIDCPALPMSSTALRESKDSLAAMVPESVLKYIKENQLYGWKK